MLLRIGKIQAPAARAGEILVKEVLPVADKRSSVRIIPRVKKSGSKAAKNQPPSQNSINPNGELDTYA